VWTTPTSDRVGAVVRMRLALGEHACRDVLTVDLDLRPIVSNYTAWEKKYQSFTRLGKGG
jgi:hypothetical protein